MSGPHDTDRLRFEALRTAHLDLVVRLTEDPEVMRFITGGRAIDRDEMACVVAEVQDHRWIAWTVADDAFAGWVSLRPDADAPAARELGYRFRRAVWGRGLATEATLAAIDHAFTELGCDRVWAQTMAVNERSRAVMDRCGLQFVRTFHQEWDEPIAGAEHGDVEYELTRARWRAATDGSDAHAAG